MQYVTTYIGFLILGQHGEQNAKTARYVKIRLPLDDPELRWMGQETHSLKHKFIHNFQTSKVLAHCLCKLFLDWRTLISAEMI